MTHESIHCRITRKYSFSKKKSKPERVLGPRTPHEAPKGGVAGEGHRAGGGGLGTAGEEVDRRRGLVAMHLDVVLLWLE